MTSGNPQRLARAYEHFNHQVDEMIERGDQVVVVSRMRGRGKGSGAEAEQALVRFRPRAPEMALAYCLYRL